jgi:hypothetical protein
MGKECEVPELSAALRFHLMLVGLLASLRAEPQLPLSMHDETELTTAMITSSQNCSPKVGNACADALWQLEGVGRTNALNHNS